jgi:pimeloyl-ACP methyl ester carboxylesterase
MNSSRRSAGTPLPDTPTPMQFWDGAKGVRIAGDHWGPDTGPLVVLLHGGGQTRHAWKGTGERLAARGYRTVALDARGHGDSDWASDGDYLQSTMVDDLVAVLAQIDPRARPVLVGASMGGGVSLRAIGEDHVDATALVLVDIAPRIEPEGVEKIRSFMFAQPEGFASLDEVADAIASYQPHRERPTNLAGLAKNLRHGEDNKFHWHWDPVFMQGPRDLGERQAQQEEHARRITVPALLVRGGLSDIVSEEGAREFLSLCTHAEYIDVVGASHMVAGDRNDVFADSVIEFLSRTVPVDGDPVVPPHVPHPHPDPTPILDVP